MPDGCCTACSTTWATACSCSEGREVASILRVSTVLDWLPGIHVRTMRGTGRVATSHRGALLQLREAKAMEQRADVALRGGGCRKGWSSVMPCGAAEPDDRMARANQFDD